MKWIKIGSAALLAVAFVGCDSLSELTELEVVDVAVGQDVSIAADALPDVEMHGTVEKISQSYKSQGGDILYTVRIKVDDVDPRMRWGMTVEVTFEPLG